jgi:hypothetical protein
MCAVVLPWIANTTRPGTIDASTHTVASRRCVLAIITTVPAMPAITT